MTETMQQINLNQLDKSTWQKYRFEQIAKSISERVDPNNTDLDVYIGLEHIDAESIHIKRTGTRDDVNGQKLRCYPGDVIFGRRRAYQRKAAIATVDGFCSAHSLVLRANADVIDPKLFPFFLHSDAFMHRAIDISVGSLSPTINWGTLKNQEFLLPPKDQQSKLAELLWAMDEVIEKEIQVSNTLDINLNAFLKQVFSSHIKIGPMVEIRSKSPFQTCWVSTKFPIGWQSVLLKTVIADCQSGFAEGNRDENGIPQLRMNNVSRDSRIDLTSIATIPFRQSIEKYRVSIGDIMFCNTNSEDLVGKSVIADNTIEGFAFSNHFSRLRPKKEYLMPKFLYLWLKYHFDIGLFESRCTRWIGQAAVQPENLLRLYIVLPPLEEQIYVGNCSIKIEHCIDKCKSKIERAKSLQKSLINQIF